HAAAEEPVVVVERGQRRALVRREHSGQARVGLRGQRRFGRGPVDGIEVHATKLRTGRGRVHPLPDVEPRAAKSRAAAPARRSAGPKAWRRSRMATRAQKIKKTAARLAGKTARAGRTAAVKGAVAGGKVAGAAVALTGLAVVAAAKQARKTVAK